MSVSSPTGDKYDDIPDIPPSLYEGTSDEDIIFNSFHYYEAPKPRSPSNAITDLTQSKKTDWKAVGLRALTFLAGVASLALVIGGVLGLISNPVGWGILLALVIIALVIAARKHGGQEEMWKALGFTTIGMTAGLFAPAYHYWVKHFDGSAPFNADFSNDAVSPPQSPTSQTSDIHASRRPRSSQSKKTQSSETNKTKSNGPIKPAPKPAKQNSFEHHGKPVDHVW